MGSRCTASGLVAVVALVGALRAQSDWAPESPSVEPAAREEHAAVCDRVRQEVVLFGGRRADGVLLGDTWVADASGWHQRTAVGPVPRRAAGIGFVATSSRTVLFGGFDASGGVLGDTWVWDGANWTAVGGAGPSPRAGTALAAEPGGGVLLFGGVDALGGRLGDTWRFDGATWTRLTPAHAPSARFGHRMAADTRHGEVLLFGGAGRPAETWLWRTGDWVRQQPVADPGPRERHTLCEDPIRGRVVLHGGTDGTAFANDDTWEWDGAQWLPRTSSSRPPARLDATLAFDAVAARCVAFGGFDGVVVRADTWTYGPSFPAQVTGFGAGCPGQLGVPQIGTRAGELPWLGDRVTVVVANTLPGSATFVHAGLSASMWGATPLPLALDFIGMPGCALLAAIDGLAPVPNVGGTAELAFQVPNVAGLRGAPLYVQALVADPGANALGVVASGGLELLLGAR